MSADSHDSPLPEEPLSLHQPIRLMRQMSHDMRVPLTALISTGDLFAEGSYGELTPKQTRANERIRRCSRRLLAILDDMMTYVKAEAGEFPLTTKPFDPRAILDRVSNQVQPTVKEKDLQFSVLTSAAVPTMLLGDEAVVTRIVAALVWNAVSFTVKGDVRVETDWISDGTWLVTVRDSGSGISPESATHIFEPFWRGDERPQVPTSGCGLGLAMALALVKLMRGTLTLKETNATGSTFALSLPLAAYKQDSPTLQSS
jgi:signal transduction histidine kinase